METFLGDLSHRIAGFSSDPEITDAPDGGIFAIWPVGDTSLVVHEPGSPHFSRNAFLSRGGQGAHAVNMAEIEKMI
jgi:hypothetical protein